MTTTPSCDVVHLSDVSRVEQSGGDNGTLFIANEMIPMMASLFIKSANQLNANLAGHAIAYRAMLRGVQAGLILDVLIELAGREPDRFAPTPQELKRMCLEKTGAVKPEAQRAFIASMASLEMQVCADVLSGKVSRSIQDIETAIDSKIRSVINAGGSVDGNRGFGPLNSIIETLKGGVA